MTLLAVDIRGAVGTFAFDARFAAPAVGITAVFGRSGSGKTTLINALAGLVRPQSGRIRLDGTTLFDAETGIHVPPERRRVGYVFQDARLFPHLTARGNLLYGAGRLPAADRRKRFDHVVGLLGVESLLQRRPRQLSGGERQRVAIGRALLSAPRLLLMDEPLASLDAERKAEILPYVERLRDEERVPIVYVSHAVGEIVRLADSLVLIADGHVVASGSAVDLMNRVDLDPVLGAFEAGTLLDGRVEGYDNVHGLLHLTVPGGTLRLPGGLLPVGTRIRLKIRARDVALALTVPHDTSVLNILSGRVRQVSADRSPQVNVLVDPLDAPGAPPLRARVTSLSAEQLGLRPGLAVHALIKAVALDRDTLAGRQGKALAFGTAAIDDLREAP